MVIENFSVEIETQGPNQIPYAVVYSQTPLWRLSFISTGNYASEGTGKFEN